MTTNIIDKFTISRESGYSEFWRRDKSPIEVIEMAKLLRSLRKVISFIGDNIGNIIWSGMEAESDISIDPTLIMGSYPISGFNVDLIVGITVQKALHKIEWTRYFKETALKELNLPKRYEIMFISFFDMCEKIYIDYLANRNILGMYAKVSRKYTVEQFLQPDYKSPAMIELLAIWWHEALNNNTIDYPETLQHQYKINYTIKPEYVQPLKLLNNVSVKLQNEIPLIESIFERGKQRAKIYTSAWFELFELVKTWEIDPYGFFMQTNYLNRSIYNFDSLGKNEEIKNRVLSFTNKLEKVINKHKPCLTERVKEFIQDNPEPVQVELNSIIMPAPNRINPKLYQNLKHVIKATSQRKTEISRGLATGKIDRRRLYRAETTKRIFEMNKFTFDLENNITVLVDATGSMAATDRWEQLEEIYQTLFNALHDFNINTRLVAYNEMNNICQLSELYKNNDFFTILPHGKTASGEAIIATAIQMKNKLRKNFIIHLTDGASNWGCNIKEAINVCKESRITLLTLGIGCSKSGKEELKKEYGKLVQFIETTDSLPTLLRNLLVYSKWNK